MHADARPAPSPRVFRVASAALFLLLGGIISLYGPTVPLFRDRFGLATAVAGMALPVHSVMSLVGVVAWGALDTRGQVRGALFGGAIAIASGAAAVALAGSFPLVLVGVGVVGLGFGVVNTGINALLARDRTAGAAARMNRVHATFGLGAVGYPLLLSFTSITVSFLAIVVPLLVVAPYLRHAVDPGVAPRRDESPRARRSVRMVLIGFVAVYVLYIGTELGVSNWMAAHLNDEGWSAPAAARWTAGFYLAFTLGRLVVARVARTQPPGRIVAVSLALGTVVTAAASVPAVTPVAYVLVGFVISPVFPTGMSWIGASLPEERHGPALAMLAAGAGGATLPAAVGGVVGAGGTDVVPWAVATIAAFGTGAAVWVRRAVDAR